MAWGQSQIGWEACYYKQVQPPLGQCHCTDGTWDTIFMQEKNNESNTQIKVKDRKAGIRKYCVRECSLQYYSETVLSPIQSGVADFLQMPSVMKCANNSHVNPNVNRWFTKAQ